MTTSVFQSSINAATRELSAECLRAMMEHPKNMELIASYRQLKHRMAEAEARQATAELVKEITATDGYTKWIARQPRRSRAASSGFRCRWARKPGLRFR